MGAGEKSTRRHFASGECRTERDYLGEMQVPVEAYYAAQTQRAVENFQISGIRFPRSLVAALGTIKISAAKANEKLGLLDHERADLIIQAAEEVERGDLDEHFVVDVYQTGSGTSSNMNANEVIANRAMEIAGGKVRIHPNDHVNMCQSSNDVIPTAIHVAVALQLTGLLMPNLGQLKTSLKNKASEFQDIVKTGRTHLQDASPITLGQEFSGYESQVEHSLDRIQRSLPSIFELPLGGTAVGTGLNTSPNFPSAAISELNKRTGLEFFEAANHFEAQAARDGLVEMSGQLKTVAASLTKIANDLRWLASGPRCGLGELQLPEVQPGSSIMPGKVNPVIAESVIMACAQVVGNDAAITAGGLGGSIFELNMMMPMMGHNILQSIMLLANSALNLSCRCIDGIKANSARLEELSEASIALCTALVPKIGYDKASQIAREAYKTGKSLREVARAQNVMSDQELDEALNPMNMTKPGL